MLGRRPRDSTTATVAATSEASTKKCHARSRRPRRARVGLGRRRRALCGRLIEVAELIVQSRRERGLSAALPARDSPRRRPRRRPGPLESATKPTTRAPVAPIRYGRSQASRLKPWSIGAERMSSPPKSLTKAATTASWSLPSVRYCAQLRGLRSRAPRSSACRSCSASGGSRRCTGSPLRAAARARCAGRLARCPSPCATQRRPAAAAAGAAATSSRRPAGSCAAAKRERASPAAARGRCRARCTPNPNQIQLTSGLIVTA